MNRQRIAKMMISALVAGSLYGLTAVEAGAQWRVVLLGALIMALKDCQSYLSTPPAAREEDKNGTDAQ